MIVVRHLNKLSGESNPLYRGGGSIGIIGAARTGYLVACDREDHSRRIFAPIKSILARLESALQYTIQEVEIEIKAQTIKSARINWLGKSSQTAADLLAVECQQRGRLQGAKSFLSNSLACGPVAAKVVEEQANALGISIRPPMPTDGSLFE